MRLSGEKEEKEHTGKARRPPMKIEFCCGEMKKGFLGGGGGMVLVGNSVIYNWVHTDTCPYCGAKIEITVKDDKR